MSEVERAKASSPWPWVFPLAAVLGVAAWLGLRKLDDPPPTPQVQRKSPGEQAMADEVVDSEHDAASTGSDTAGAGPSAEADLSAALQAEADGDIAGAYALAQSAARASGARDAKLLEAKLAITQGKPAAAVRPLEDILRQNPDDADALYNSGLLWQQHQPPNYGKARTNYLATLRAEPRYAAARYNLVVLSMDHGALDEAKHHLDLYREAWPKDPKLPALLAAYEAKAARAGTSPRQGAG